MGYNETLKHSLLKANELAHRHIEAKQLKSMASTNKSQRNANASSAAEADVRHTRYFHEVEARQPRVEVKKRKVISDSLKVQLKTQLKPIKLRMIRQIMAARCIQRGWRRVMRYNTLGKLRHELEVHGISPEQIKAGSLQEAESKVKKSKAARQVFSKYVRRICALCLHKVFAAYQMYSADDKHLICSAFLSSRVLLLSFIHVVFKKPFESEFHNHISKQFAQYFDTFHRALQCNEDGCLMKNISAAASLNLVCMIYRMCSVTTEKHNLQLKIDYAHSVLVRHCAVQMADSEKFRGTLEEYLRLKQKFDDALNLFCYGSAATTRKPLPDYDEEALRQFVGDHDVDIDTTTTTTKMERFRELFLKSKDAFELVTENLYGGGAAAAGHAKAVLDNIAMCMELPAVNCCGLNFDLEEALKSNDKALENMGCMLSVLMPAALSVFHSAVSVARRRKNALACAFCASACAPAPALVSASALTVVTILNAAENDLGEASASALASASASASASALAGASAESEESLASIIARMKEDDVDDYFWGDDTVTVFSQSPSGGGGGGNVDASDAMHVYVNYAKKLEVLWVNMQELLRVEEDHPDFNLIKAVDLPVAISFFLKSVLQIVRAVHVDRCRTRIKLLQISDSSCASHKK